MTQLELFPALPPVRRGMSWAELFGQPGELDADARRERWRAFLAISDPETVDYWTDTEGCHDERGTCRHLDGHWCTLMGLPASVNPVLTMRVGMIGMACMGAGFETTDGQKADTGDFPF